MTSPTSSKVQMVFKMRIRSELKERIEYNRVKKEYLKRKKCLRLGIGLMVDYNLQQLTTYYIIKETIYATKAL